MLERQNMFQQLLKSAADGILIVDAAGRILWVNEQAEKLFGYRSEELVNQPVDMLVPEKLRRSHARSRRSYLSQPRNRPMGENLALLAQHKNGSTWPVEISLSYSGQGEDLRVMALVQDVSERRRMESALRQSEGRYRSMTDDVLDTSTVGTLVLDAETRVVWFNRALEVFFAIARADWLGRPLPELFRQVIVPLLEEGSFHLARIEQNYLSGSSFSQYEYHLRGEADLPERWLAHHSQAISSGIYRGGRIEHFYDITRLKELELARASQLAEHIRDLEAEIGHLARLVKPTGIEITAQLMGVETLQRHLPKVFDELVDEYALILNQALESRILKTGVDLSSALAKLGESLGFLRATPRDLIDLHRQVLLVKRIQDSPEKMRGLIEEGHLLLIELMGNLVHFYRRKAVLFRGEEEIPAVYQG